MANYKIQKLDKRFEGCEWFTHRIDVRLRPIYQSVAMFIDVRLWMTETYGYSMELENHMLLSHTNPEKINPLWAWKSHDSTLYIYINTLAPKGDSVLNWFQLKW